MSSSAIPTTGVTAQSIDVSSLVSQLIAAEQQPITVLNNQISSYQSKISAIGGVQSALSSLQTAAQGLNSMTFTTPQVTSSDSGISGTASSIATSGSYSLNVSQLAQAQSLVAAGQPSATTTIGSGTPTTLTFNFGTISGGTLSGGTYTGSTFTASGAGAQTVTINSSNNTLTGIRDAINAANIGVTASIINDGSSNPYRLVLTSNTPGASNSMQISVSGDSAISSLLSENPAGTQNLTQTAAAQNANFTVNGIAISSPSNTDASVIQGVTLNLTGTTTSPATLTVAPNSSSITSAINTFVQAYNGAVSAIQTQTSYDPTTKVAGTLQGDISLSILQSQMASMLTTNVGSGQFTNLSQIGIGIQQNGTLAVNTTTLNNALSSNYQSVANLFVSSGSVTDNLASYVSASSSTQAGTYGINVAQLPTQGSAVGSTAAGLTISSGSNDSLSLSVDGVATSITIPANSYTASSLATELQSLINSSSPISSAGKSVVVTQNAGVLSINSGSYGSASSVTITGGDAISNLFGTPTQTSGLDVSGTINGLAASGSGQVLTSSSGNSAGLSVSIQGGTTGNRGTVSYSQGLSNVLNSWVTSILGSSGPLSSETTQYNDMITSAQKQITALNTQIATDQTNLTQQYSQLDATLGTMYSLSSYLTQQLSQLSS